MEKYLEIFNEKYQYQIPAVLTCPAKDNFPVAVLLHGTASNKDEVGNGYKMLAQSLLAKGIGSIRFDFPGNGDHKADYKLFDFDSAMEDIRLVIETLNKEVKVSELYLLGWSQGGSLALLQASINPIFKKVVLWSGAAEMKELANDHDYNIALKQGYYRHEFDFRDPCDFSLKWYQDVRSTDLYTKAKSIEVPILAIAGKNDDVVNPQQSKRIIDESCNQDSKLVMVDGDHVFNCLFEEDEKTLKEVIELTVNWLQ